MDGSRTAGSSSVRGNATRLALSVDPEAVGLMRHASELGHLIEWWLQSQPGMTAMNAFRLGRKLERFRLAARLAEGRSSKQAVASLASLRTELQNLAAPGPIADALDKAFEEAERLEGASANPATVVRRAFGEPEFDTHRTQGASANAPASEDPEEDAAPARGRGRTLVLTALMAAAGAIYWFYGGGSAMLGPLLGLQ
jgi:hypothetical protein